MKTNKWDEYEAEKRKLIALNLDSFEYERRLDELIKRLKL